MKNVIGLTLLFAIGLTPLFTLGGKNSRKIPSAVSKNGSDLPISSGTLIEILSYDPKTKTFEIQAAALPGEGESWVTPEALAEASEAASLDRLLKDPKSFVGQQFQIKRELPTLFDEERDSRSSPTSSENQKKNTSNGRAARK